MARQRSHITALVNLGAGVALALAAVVPAPAQVCTNYTNDNDPAITRWFDGSPPIPMDPNCQSGFRCFTPEVDPFITQVVGGCDPVTAPAGCVVRASAQMRFPGVQQNPFVGNTWVRLLWFNGQGTQVAECGTPGAIIQVDRGTATIERGGFRCNAAGSFGNTYTVRARVCELACLRETIVNVDLTRPAVNRAVCPQPKTHSCPRDAKCEGCKGPLGSAPVEGSAPGLAMPKSAPGDGLRYSAGGVGFSGQPGSNLEAGGDLGRGWAHKVFQRIVLSPDASNVFLVSDAGTFRQFSDLNLDGVYVTEAPSDEYRKLTKTPTGWSLRDLDGTVTTFGAAGEWLSTSDRNNNVVSGLYAAGVLVGIDHPDGRSEQLTRHPDGKIETWSEIGVDGTTTRTYSYVWDGEDLEQISRPDGTKYRIDYDPSCSGHASRLTLIGTDLSERIEAGWRYDGSCRVIAVWKGAAQPEDAAAVDVWRFAFNANPATQTTVTDPLGKIATYVIERDPRSSKPRIKKTTDDCPSCAMGANTERFFDDPTHPMLPTREVTPDGTTQLMAYDANGQLTSRVEAFNTPLERETTYQYDSTFPALLTEMEQPSTSGSTLEFRRLVIGRDAQGNEITREMSGMEDGLPFSFVTTTTNTPEGLPEVIDPPGYAVDDQIQWSFDPTRGNLVPMSRTDPVVGTSTLGHDPFNRQVSQTDPNGVTSEVVLDALDRPLFEIQRGATPVEDLVVEKRYTVFGDLELTILPRGNAILNSYDHAGRLVAVERKPSADPASHGERTSMTLDDAGNVIKEELQRWDGSGWFTESTTERVYTTRCHADKVIRGAGSASPSTAEFAYDCKNRLQKIWDSNHPSNNQTALASTTYVHDRLDRITSVSQPWGGAGGGTVTTLFEWDVQDHLERVIDPEGGETLYEWSDRDLKSKEISEVSGESQFSYNEHGEMDEKVDARGVVVSYTIDAADRVTFADYPGTALDTVYTFDDALVPFSKGRLTNISRAGNDIPYRYDRFGRSTRDGALEMVLDKNGNREEIVYPGGVRALYSHDYADRQATLSVAVPGESVLPVVESASYLPMGPLTALELGNGLTETHLFDARYYPQRITVTGATALLDWQYTVDAEGNPTAIADLLDPEGNRSFGYQDWQYYLTLGNGPWGNLSWEYDRIGSRKRETRDGVTDLYTYVPNALGGNTAKLAQIALGAGGTKIYQFDAAGNQSQVTTGPDVVVLSHDEANQLAAIERPSAGVRAEMFYDGRGFLRHAEEQHPGRIFADGFETGGPACWSAVVGGAGGGETCPLVPNVGPVYSSDGMLRYQLKEGGLERYVLYFGGRPVLTLAVPAIGVSTKIFLGSDHLGTPNLASNTLGGSIWEGGFEAFGVDYSGSSQAELFLRQPGQWQDDAWKNATLPNNFYYNLYRWYYAENGRYTGPDPVDLFGYSLYVYALSDPINVQDPLGLLPEGTSADATCLICTVYAEARGQPKPCQYAVASIILNRIRICRSFGVATTTCDVVSSAAQFDGYGDGNQNYRSCRECTEPKDELAATWQYFQDAFPVGPDDATHYGNNSPGIIRYFKGTLGLTPVDNSNCSVFVFFKAQRDPFVRPVRPSFCR